MIIMSPFVVFAVVIGMIFAACGVSPRKIFFWGLGIGLVAVVVFYAWLGTIMNESHSTAPYEPQYAARITPRAYETSEAYNNCLAHRSGLVWTFPDGSTSEQRLPANCR